MNYGADNTESRRPGGGGSVACPRLLAVDDEPDSAELIARIAERCGYESRFIATPEDVPAAVQQWRPDLIVTDICMPQMDAIELMSILEFEGFDGEAIIVSGQGETILQQTQRLAELRGLRVLAALQKPVDSRRLKELLASRLPAEAAAGINR